MGKELIDELFEKPDVEFAEHINDNDNARILFSGKFGIGKTTFINHFFEKNENDFVKIHLFPVNYSIASNEDIMELVKYDILMELIRKGAEFTCEDISIKERIVGFTKNNAQELVKLIAKKIPSLGGEDIAGIGISELVDDLSKLYSSFQEYCEEAKQDEGEAANEFLEMIQAEKGSIYEQGIVTKLIRDKVSALKNKENHTKKVVLVIDDLDRIDPEHIFRLFNVFAAHFDSSDCDSSSNKFDFDKVVFVCDVNNIRSIFKHRYGAETDFGGYIDKFFSKEIFEFDNVYNLIEIAKLLTDKIFNKHKQYIRCDYNRCKDIIFIFIKICLEKRLINLRVLCKKIDLISKNNHYQSIWIPKNNDRINPFEIPIYISTLIIKSMFGDDTEFKNILKNNKNKTDINECLQDLYFLIKEGYFIINIYQHKEYIKSNSFIHIDTKIITFPEDNFSYQQKLSELKVNSLAVFYETLLFIEYLNKNNYEISINAPVYQS